MLFGLSLAFLTGCGSSKNAMDNSLPDTPETSDTIQADTSKVDPIALKEEARRDSLEQLYKDELHKTHQIQANRITSLYISAQQKFYNNEFQEALALINAAASIKQTADILALKGSIYLGLGSIENFVTYWKQALDLDKDLPIPPSPVIVAELKKQGLIDEFPDRNPN